MSSEPSAARLAYAWRDALTGRDAERFGSLFVDDALFVDVEHRTDDLSETRPILGRPAIEEMCRAWLAATPDFDYDVLDVLADETTGAARWRYRVDGLELDGVTWLTCADGRISEARVYFDSLALYRGLGRV